MNREKRKFNFLFWWFWFMIVGMIPPAYMNFVLHLRDWSALLILVYISIFYTGSFWVMIKLHPIEKKVTG